MTLLGLFRDDHPRLTLPLPGRSGRLWVEFIVDTGFAGDLALPQSLIQRLEANLSGSDSFALADGSRLECWVYRVLCGYVPGISVKSLWKARVDPHPHSPHLRLDGLEQTPSPSAMGCFSRVFI